ncbi:hypothetical protein B0H17DRAFT_512325 [Mycena rosella]|uniref:Uncharacterized protein n=1 Tax=Mycena rosella TaxID=1033263 RepID=A0AAD7DK85_MYCRO|nr:hypothetical protein B0H17DRAFT_512325 [Mycena rosella]
MNSFGGDLAHMASKCILIWYIHRNKSAEGKWHPVSVAISRRPRRPQAFSSSHRPCRRLCSPRATSTLACASSLSITPS